MFKRKNRKNLLGILIGAGSVVTLGLGAALLHYLRSGVGDADASLIPNSIEERLDKVVEALNKKFGKRWVNRGVATLQAGLSTVLPAPLVGLVEVVHRVEHLAEQHGWKSQEKLTQAAGMV
jgi:hypothetical protein